MAFGARAALSGVLIAGCLFASGPAPVRADAPPEIPVLARVGPWPAASRPIGFDGRVWFANSVKGVNHNSADIYSYDPRSGALRHERHLFSQDAGQPLAWNGLLYWPFEDPRASLAWGEYMVSDGSRWRLGTIPTARIYHVHAMAGLGRSLVAATSAWRAGLQVSRDGGASWRQVYDHPTPARRVSRIVALAATDTGVYAQLIERGRHRLLRFDGEVTEEVPGWPAERPIVGLAAYRGAVYALVRETGGVSVWRSDGRHSARLFGPRPQWRARSIAAGAGGLWAVSAEDRGGALWHSADGTDWRAIGVLSHGKPEEIAVTAEGVYVTGAGDDGRGILWGPGGGLGRPAPGAADAPRAELPQAPAQAVDLDALGRRLDRALLEPESYAGHGAILRDLVHAAARGGAPAAFFSDRLTRPMARHELPLIGGNVRVPADRLGRWILLWGMALGGRGRVPLELILEPWRAEANGSQKYFAAPPMAAWAAAAVGQRDRATLAALIERLARPEDPRWLRGDVIGALAALTGQRFAYDIAAWRAWWHAAAPSWPE
jgi:hypothetical protein